MTSTLHAGNGSCSLKSYTGLSATENGHDFPARTIAKSFVISRQHASVPILSR
jgi:hypothetical protein